MVMVIGSKVHTPGRGFGEVGAQSGFGLWGGAGCAENPSVIILSSAIGELADPEAATESHSAGNDSCQQFILLTDGEEN